jgi:hypothetical protein
VQEVEEANYLLLVVPLLGLKFHLRDLHLPEVTPLHIVLLLFLLVVLPFLPFDDDILSLLYESFYFYAFFFE